MIRLPNITLAAPVQQKLNEYQGAIDALATYAQRVDVGKTRFSQYNKPSNSTFREVRNALVEMCSGPRRCCYCEDSFADEVEHIRPKDLYPDYVFRWENYLYSCGRCNGSKLNRFAVFSGGSNDLVDVTRARSDAVVEPVTGDQVFVDPRNENPFEFMDLDLVDTFFFVPAGTEGTRKFLRAHFTIQLLGLNDRDALVQGRRSAYGSYRARLDEYHSKKEDGHNAAELDGLANGIRTMGHPTVWHEMKRQREFHAELLNLFENVPEALDW